MMTKAVKWLLIVSMEELKIIMSTISQKPVTSSNIPQYSSFENGTYQMLKYLRMAGDFGPSFLEIGKHFSESGHKNGAYVKYGENHAKLAELLGLVKIKKTDRKRVFLSDLGREIERLDIEKQQDCYTKLASRIPIVQEAIKLGLSDAKELEKHLHNYLSPVTAVRRRKNTWSLIEKILGCENNGV